MRCLILLVLICLAIVPARADDLDVILEAGVIRVGVCLESAPLGYRDNSGTARGFDVDVAARLARALGVGLQLVEVSGSVRISELLANRIDVIACHITATTERALKIDFSHPYMRTGSRLVYRQASGLQGIDRLEEIAPGMRIAVGRGTTGETLVQQRAPQVEMVYVDNPGDATLMLMLGSVDAYVEDSLVADVIARTHPGELDVSDATFSADAIAFGIRKGNPEFLRWLDLFASLFVSSGAYDEMYRKWWDEPPLPLEAVW